MPDNPGPFALRCGEILSYAAGVLLLGFFLVQIAWGEIERQVDIAQFEDAQAAGFDLSGTGEPDTSLWAPGRIDDYRASLTEEMPEILGVLEIDSVGLKVPVYATATDLVMDRGAGIIDGMAYPHEPGNIGISGHRDGYFRVLKDVKVGDEITLQTLDGVKRFRVSNMRVVEISNRDVLQDTDETQVTLITCYPFYFVGHAPKRYIVTASLDTTYVNRK